MVKMESAVDRHVFYISDGTAITAEVLGHAVMSQFPVATSSVTLPFVENISRARAVKEQIDAIFQQTGIRPLVFYSIVLPEIRDIILQSEGFCQDIVQAAPFVPACRRDQPGPVKYGCLIIACPPLPHMGVGPSRIFVRVAEVAGVG